MSLLQHAGEECCAPFRAKGGRCIRAGGLHLHWCGTCDSLVRQHGNIVACDRRCLLVTYNLRVELEAASADNDFNPLVNRICGCCAGAGFTLLVDSVANQSIQVTPCQECDTHGMKTLRRYDESQTVGIAPDANGWGRCPKCGFKFKPADPNTTIGPRHRRCGQKFHVE